MRAHGRILSNKPNMEAAVSDCAKLKKQWRHEEEFSFKGWDFSHIGGRWESEPLPWDYREIIKTYLKSTDFLLDMGTGGGEFLLSLAHPHALTSVTEAYPPNVELCRQRLAPLGISVKQTYEDEKLPYADASFDMVVNRHESYDLSEVERVLKSGGYFITQQVGGKNNNDLSRRLLDGFVPQFPNHTLNACVLALEKQGFTVLRAEKAYPYLRFFDVGALVYFAKIIEWEFPDFSVEASFEKLCACQAEVEARGFVQGTEHRFLTVARKAGSY